MCAMCAHLLLQCRTRRQFDINDCVSSFQSFRYSYRRYRVIFCKQFVEKQIIIIKIKTPVSLWPSID